MTGTLGQVARRWWPVPAMLAAVVAVQIVWSGRYQPTGHAAEHLSSATAVFALTLLAAVTLWALPGRLRRQPEVWVLLAAIVGAAVAVAVGNVQVVDAIGADDWSTEQAEALGSLRPGFASGHDLARLASWTVQISVLALAGWLAWRRAVPVGVAVAGAVLTIIVPAWIFPGAGLVVLAVGLCVRRARPVDPAPATLRR